MHCRVHIVPVLLALIGFGCAARAPQPATVQSTLAVAAAAPAPEPTRVEFATDIRPIVDRCTPCHFPGGVMYEQLPFDKPETIVALGEKLFTRIRDEQERTLIRAFLASAAETRTR